jgi:AcrR family transcriptional regulator
MVKRRSTVHRLPIRSRAEVDQARRERTRVRLVEAGLRVVAAKGAQSAVIEDFIGEAKVARGTFYNHFKTREDLLAVLGDHMRLDFQSACDAAAAGVDDPAERLIVGVRHVIGRAVSDPEWGWLVIHFRFDESMSRDDFPEHPKADITAAIAAGRLPADTDADLAAGLLLAAMCEAVRRVLRAPPTADLPERVAAFILAGMGLPWSEAHAVARRPLPPIGVQATRKARRHAR